MTRTGPSPLETPMMRQYLEVKAERPDCLLLMRMGDFYEAFLEDAQELARILGVALTARNKEAEHPIAMAGVPHHSLRGHLPKLLAAGKRIAVMDQLEDPKDAKGLVRRGVTRVITPGTALDEVDSAAANYLVACTALDGTVGVAALDVSTGRFTVEEATSSTELGLILGRLQPAELLLPEALHQDPATAKRLAGLLVQMPTLSSLPAYAWKPADAARHLRERLRVASLEGFGIGSDDAHLAGAAGAALRYAEGTLRAGADGADPSRALGHIRTITRIQHGEHLVLDGVCRRQPRAGAQQPRWRPRRHPPGRDRPHPYRAWGTAAGGLAGASAGPAGRDPGASGRGGAAG